MRTAVTQTLLYVPGEWYRWYAWRPVRADCGEHRHCWVWREYVWRAYGVMDFTWGYMTDEWYKEWSNQHG